MFLPCYEYEKLLSYAWRRKRLHMMKKVLFSILVGLLTLGSALWADKEEPAFEVTLYPTTGVRFVVCSPSDGKLPSPLYALYNDKYLPIYISSRGPSERVLPSSDGHVRLYEKNPQDAENPGTPYLDIALPSQVSKGKVICIVAIAGQKAKPQYYFMREADLPVGGFYVINFSPVAIEMVVVTKAGQIPENGAMISPYRKPEDNCIVPSSPNLWSFLVRDHPGVKNLEYVLRVPASNEDEVPMPLRGSRFPLSKSMSHVTIVVKHPTNPQAFSLISFSYSSASDKRNEANAKASQGARRGAATPVLR